MGLLQKNSWVFGGIYPGFCTLSCCEDVLKIKCTTFPEHNVDISLLLYMCSVQ